MPLPISSGLGGKYGRIIDAILAELRALRPVPGINTFAGQNSIGTSRTVQPVGTAPIIQQLTVQIEGADALLCTDADGNDVYAMKPYTLQATQWVDGGPQGGTNFIWDASGAQATYFIDHSFVLTKSDTWGDEHLKIWPPYSWSNPANGAWPTTRKHDDVGAFGHTILAARLPATVGIDAAQLALVPSSFNPDVSPDTQVRWMDLNVIGRKWTPIAAVTTSQFVTVGGTDYPVKGT